MRYSIADHLSEVDKQRILAHRFVRSGEPTGEELNGEAVIYHGLVPVSADDQFCPLAYVDGIDFNPSAPDADSVSRAIARQLDDYPHDMNHESDSSMYGYCDCLERLIGTIYDAAAVFIDDWDSGNITDLYAALGVKREGL